MLKSKKSILHNIIIVVDGSDASFRAAEHAILLAKSLDSHITALAVVDTEILNRLLQTRIFIEEEREEYERDMEQSSAAHLEHIARIAQSHRVSVETKLLKGSMHRTVIAHAETLKADLIVLGKWRYSLTERDIIAAERQRILIEAPCPVLVAG